MRTSMLQRLLGWLRHGSDRARHRSRREEALARLRAGSRPRSVLVLCHGNLCRSPYTAAVLRRSFQESGLPIDVESAGYFNPNRAPPAEAIEAAAARGFDMSGHRPQLVTRTLIGAADLVVVMDEDLSRAVVARSQAMTSRVLVLGDLDPLPISTRAILDPFGGPRAAFDRCYARIDRCAAELVRTFLDRDRA